MASTAKQGDDTALDRTIDSRWPSCHRQGGLGQETWTQDSGDGAPLCSGLSSFPVPDKMIFSVADHEQPAIRSSAAIATEIILSVRMGRIILLAGLYPGAYRSRPA